MNERTPAGFFERAGALAIDAGIFVGFQGTLLQTWGMAVAPFGGSISQPFWPWSLLMEAALVTAALAYAYRWKRSPAMSILGLDLVDAGNEGRARLWKCVLRAIPVVAGSVAGFLACFALLVAGAPHGQFVLRTLYLWIPLAALGGFLLTYTPMAFTPKRQSLWDLLTGTKVVKSDKVPSAITAYR
jgi:uncharacterized RDD family membrane protein YckC